METPGRFVVSCRPAETVLQAGVPVKVKELSDHESKTDPVFYCGKPACPASVPPRKILQLRIQTIFALRDISW